MLRLKILDPVDCEILEWAGSLRWLKQLVSYKDTYFKPGRFGGGKQTEYNKTLLVDVRPTKAEPQRRIYMATGFLPRVAHAAARDGVKLRVEGTPERLIPDRDPHVPGKELREDQLRLIASATAAHRGLIVAPTGSGKTVVIMGLISQFSAAKMLIVCHSIDLVKQTATELAEHGFSNVEVTTRQSLVGKHKNGKPYIKRPEYLGEVDIVIIDEVHLFSDMSGQYATILRHTTAPMRFGFTATAPPGEGKIAMALEGLVGPLIDEVTVSEGQELDIIADVQLQLIPVRMNKTIAQAKTYREIYKRAIVENRSRNYAVIRKAIELVDDGRTVLIFVTELIHGDTLMKVCALLGQDALFVQGNSENDARALTKMGLQDGSVPLAICTKVWREGINIPNLGAVIFAGGGKAQLSTLQSMGRALRKVKGKDKAVLVDFLDGYPWLAVHTVHRLALYSTQGWLQ